MVIGVTALLTRDTFLDGVFRWIDACTFEFLKLTVKEFSSENGSYAAVSFCFSRSLEIRFMA